MTLNRDVVTLGAFILFAITIALATGAEAIPHVYIASAAFGGDDANDGSNKHPVLTARRVTELCSVNGVMADPCDTGLKWDKDDTPTIDISFLEMFTRHKADKVERKEQKEVVAGHGNLPDVDEIGSAENGFGVRKKYVWLTFVNQNGTQEYLSNVETSIYSR